MCNKYKAYIFWAGGNSLATIATKNTKKTFQLNLLVLMGMIATTVVVVIHQIYLHAVMMDRPTLLSHILICGFVFVAAFVYEVLAISFLDRIGYEEKN